MQALAMSSSGLLRSLCFCVIRPTRVENITVAKNFVEIRRKIADSINKKLYDNTLGRLRFIAAVSTSNMIA